MWQLVPKRDIFHLKTPDGKSRLKNRKCSQLHLLRAFTSKVTFVQQTTPSSGKRRWNTFFCSWLTTYLSCSASHVKWTRKRLNPQPCLGWEKKRNEREKERDQEVVRQFVKKEEGGGGGEEKRSAAQMLFLLSRLSRRRHRHRLRESVNLQLREGSVMAPPLLDHRWLAF